MRQYLALGLGLAFVESCVQPPLPPEPPIVMVISQCRGADAGEPVTVTDPPPKLDDDGKTPPSVPAEEVTAR